MKIYVFSHVNERNRFNMYSCSAGDIPVGRCCEGFRGTICGAED